MSIGLGFWIVCVLGLARQEARDAQAHDDFTRRITDELSARDPQAAELFTQANAARDRDSLGAAEEFYRATLARVPDFFHAQRRLAGVLLREDKRPEALTLARAALKAADTPENRSVLVQALADRGGHPPPSQPEIREAVALGRPLLKEKDAELLLPLAQAAILADDLPLLRECVSRLERERPGDPATHFLSWTVALSQGQYDEAEKILDRAAAAGMKAEDVAGLRAATQAARPWMQRWLPIAARIALGWALALALLLGAGMILSRVTLRAAARLPTQASGEFVGLDATLRRAYQLVLWLVGAFYYVSIPLVLVAVVGLGGAVLYGFYELGRIPVRLAAIVAMVVLVTVWVALKSLWVAGRDEDPGERLDLDTEPRVRALLDEVAERIGTRPVDNVYLTPGTELAVTERGGLGRQLGGQTERCLILGVGVLEGLRLGPFRALLAHEYGHFHNRDTAGGGFALTVRRSLLTMANGLARGGVARVYNPAWLFLNGFYRVFLRISQGASRLQEMMADRWAAFAYGAQAFEQGLRHVIERSVRFARAADRDIRRAIEQQVPLTNLYSGASSAGDDTEVEAKVAALIDARPTPYDSHPAPKDRLTWVQRLATSSPVAPDAEQEVWSLFSAPLELQTRMTTLVRENVVASLVSALPCGAPGSSTMACESTRRPIRPGSAGIGCPRKAAPAPAAPGAPPSVKSSWKSGGASSRNPPRKGIDARPARRPEAPPRPRARRGLEGRLLRVADVRHVGLRVAILEMERASSS